MLQHTHTLEGQEMTESGSKTHLSNHKGITIHVTLEELKRYHSLMPEQKRLIRVVVKMLIYNPDLLTEPGYLHKLLTAKAISPYVCPLCLMPFSSSVSLKQHVRYAEHMTTCPVCRKEFANTDSTLDHVCKKHNICVG